MEAQWILAQGQADNAVPGAPQEKGRVEGIDLPKLAALDTGLDQVCHKAQQSGAAVGKALRERLGFRDSQIAMLEKHQRLKIFGLAQKIISVGLSHLENLVSGSRASKRGAAQRLFLIF